MSLSDALRAAALERAKESGQNVDGVVIEPSGVIDLREMARSASRETDRSVKLPTLAERVRADREAGEHDRSLTETSLWRRLRPNDPEPTDEPAEPVVDLTDGAGEPAVDLALPARDLDEATPFEDLLPTDDSASTFEPIVIDLTAKQEPPEIFQRHDGGRHYGPLPGANDEPSVTSSQENRPSAMCDRCGSFGYRDLYEAFSRTEYYSCSDCGHMWQQRAGD